MAADDNRLDNAFTKSHRPGDGEPYSSTADADDMFDSKIDIWWSLDGELDIAWSVFVRATRFMMQAAVLLAVPMLIFTGLKLAFSMGDETKMKEALKQIWRVAAGVVLALMSVMIIFLVSALMQSSISAGV